MTSRATRPLALLFAIACGSHESDTTDTGPDCCVVLDAEGAYRIEGVTEFLELGYEIHIADLDDDGAVEIVASAPSPYSVEYLAQVYVLPGQPGPGNVEAVSLGWYTGSASDFLGLLSGILGDVDANGGLDLGMGADEGGFVTQWSDGIPGPDTPKEEYGGRLFLPWDLAYAHLGEAKQAACGDITHDGADDLCVTFDGQYVQGGTPGGVVFVGPLLPGDNEPTSWLQWMIDADQSTEAAVGGQDVDGDGLVDLLLGMPYDEAGLGTVRIATDFGNGDVVANDLQHWTGDYVSGYFGDFLAIGGDFDQDGLVDFLASAHMADGTTGRLYAITDKDGGPMPEAAHTLLLGVEPAGWFGISFTVGDFDGDDFDDVAVGAPQNQYFAFDRPGTAFVFRGPLNTGTVSASDADRVLVGTDQPDLFGRSLAAGDLDLDGADDLVVGAKWDSLRGERVGAVYVFPGAGL